MDGDNGAHAVYRCVHSARRCVVCVHLLKLQIKRVPLVFEFDWSDASMRSSLSRRFSILTLELPGEPCVHVR